MQELRTRCGPSFLNRIDEVVIFRPLGRQDLDRIVDIQLDHLRKRLSDRRIGLDVTSAAKALLAREGTTPRSARGRSSGPCKRLVQDPARPEAASSASFKDGDTVTVDAEGDHLVFRRSVTAEIVG